MEKRSKAQGNINYSESTYNQENSSLLKSIGNNQENSSLRISK